jgi:hypothetical protein
MANDKIRLFSRLASTIPMATTAEILSATTDASGSAYVAFASNVCDALDIVNTTGAAIEYIRNGTGPSMVIPDKTGRLVTGISNANEISVRRVDLSTTQVDLKAEALVL